MRTALVTGANKGIGLEFVRQLKELEYHVIGCCRMPTKATALRESADEVIQLDVTDDNQIKALKEHLHERPIDLLINNAGISGMQGVEVGAIDRDNFLAVFNVNCVSVIKLTDSLLSNIEHSQDKNANPKLKN